jgi:hypothetical protein
MKGRNNQAITVIQSGNHGIAVNADKTKQKKQGQYDANQ